MQKLIWTEERDAKLRELRFAGLSWQAIAGEMELGRNTVLERGRKLCARKAPVLAGFGDIDLQDRPPLPPGHPVSWSAATDGTVLEGAAYPFPVFL